MNTLKIGAASAVVIINEQKNRNPIKRPRNGLGFVYAIEGGDFIKIGYSWSPSIRIKQLQTGFPLELKLVGKRQTPHPDILEKMWHRYLASYRQNGEWFRIPLELKQRVISELTDGIVPPQEGIEFAGLISRCPKCKDGRAYHNGWCFSCGAKLGRYVCDKAA